LRTHGHVIDAQTIEMRTAATNTYTGHGPNRSSSDGVLGFLFRKP
jgi:hypothetical protein